MQFCFLLNSLIQNTVHLLLSLRVWQKERKKIMIWLWSSLDKYFCKENELKKFIHLEWTFLSFSPMAFSWYMTVKNFTSIFFFKVKDFFYALLFSFTYSLFQFPSLYYNFNFSHFFFFFKMLFQNKTAYRLDSAKS